MARSAQGAPGAAAVDRSQPRAHPGGLSLNPFRAAAGLLGYLGGAMVLSTRSTWAIARSGPGDPGLLGGTARQVDRLVGLGLGVVALVHVGMGSFLAMQAYFGATFVDGIGPVVGVSLIRNLAPLLVGFLLAILVAVLFVVDLRTHDAGHPTAVSPREVAVRVLGAAVAGPILASWGSLVGVAIGWLVARSMMGVSEPVFFDLMLEMLWARDILGLAVKGAAFGGVAALLACHEARRPSRPGEDPRGIESVGRAACRSAVLACAAILAINAAWFVFVYHAGPAFGPTLLVPPGR